MTTTELTEKTFWNRLAHKTNTLLGRFQKPVQAGRVVGVGIVGAGNVVRWKYVPQLSTRPYLKPRLVYDVNAAASQQVAHALHARFTTQYEELLADKNIEAIFICTPPVYHADLAIAALAAGKHVLCEKPMAYSLAQAQAMYQAASEARTVNMIHFTYRFTAEGSLVHKIVKSEVLGKLYNVWGNFSQGGWLDHEQQPTSERVDAAPWRYREGGGIVAEMGSHLVDLCRWCFGEVANVCSWKRSFRSETEASEDLCGFTLFFESDCVAHLEVSRIATGYRERNFLEIYGSKGSLRIDQGGVYLWTRQVPRWRSLLVSSNPSGEFLDLFYRAVIGAQPAPTYPTFADGLRNNELLDLIAHSAKSPVSHTPIHG